MAKRISQLDAWALFTISQNLPLDAAKAGFKVDAHRILSRLQIMGLVTTKYEVAQVTPAGREAFAKFMGVPLT
jgi:superfamily II helicase